MTTQPIATLFLTLLNLHTLSSLKTLIRIPLVHSHLQTRSLLSLSHLQLALDACWLQPSKGANRFSCRQEMLPVVLGSSVESSSLEVSSHSLRPGSSQSVDFLVRAWDCCRLGTGSWTTLEFEVLLLLRDPIPPCSSTLHDQDMLQVQVSAWQCCTSQFHGPTWEPDQINGPVPKWVQELMGSRFSFLELVLHGCFLVLRWESVHFGTDHP